MRRGISFWAELLTVGAIFIVTNLASAAFQAQITVADGKGWDGVAYYTVADQLAHGIRPSAEAPFVYRIGTPLLASLVSRDDLVLGFKMANLVANSLTTLLLVVWLRLFVKDWRIRIGLVAAFVLQWHGPVRFVHFYPVSPDPWLATILLAGLMIAYELRFRATLRLMGAVSLLAVAGVLVRESGILLALVLPFVRNPLRFARRLPRVPVAFLVPAALGVGAFLLVYEFVRPASTYAYGQSWFVWWKPAPAYALGWWFAFGPLLGLPLFRWRATLAFLREHQYMAVLLVALAVFSWIGGIDTERYLYWGAPVVLVLIGRALEDTLPLLTRPVLVLLIAAQALSERVLWSVPDASTADASKVLDVGSAGAQFLLLTPLGPNTQYLSIFPFWMPALYTRVLLAEYAVLAVLVIAWLYWRSARLTRWWRVPGDRSAIELEYQQPARVAGSSGV